MSFRDLFSIILFSIILSSLIILLLDLFLILDIKIIYNGERIKNGTKSLPINGIAENKLVITVAKIII